MKKLVTATVAASAIVLAPATAANAAPAPDPATIECGPGQRAVGAQCVDVTAPTETPEQKAAWETLVFGGLLVIYGVGTAIVGV